MSITTVTTEASPSQSELTSLRAAIASQTAVPGGPVTLLDRLAMRAGLALILWSRGRSAATAGAGRTTDRGPRDWRSGRPLRQQRPFC